MRLYLVSEGGRKGLSVSEIRTGVTNRVKYSGWRNKHRLAGEAKIGKGSCVLLFSGQQGVI